MATELWTSCAQMRIANNTRIIHSAPQLCRDLVIGIILLNIIAAGQLKIGHGTFMWWIIQSRGISWNTMKETRGIQLAVALVTILKYSSGGRNSFYWMPTRQKRLSLSCLIMLSWGFRSVFFCLWSVQIARRVQAAPFQRWSSWFLITGTPIFPPTAAAAEAAAGVWRPFKRPQAGVCALLVNVKLSLLLSFISTARSNQRWAVDIELQALAFPKL